MNRALRLAVTTASLSLLAAAFAGCPSDDPAGTGDAVDEPGDSSGADDAGPADEPDAGDPAPDAGPAEDAIDTGGGDDDAGADPVDASDAPADAADEGDADGPPPADASDPTDLDEPEVEQPPTLEELGGEGLGVDYDATEPGATPRFEPDATDWMAVGWPTDALRDPDTGALDLSGFPNPGIDLLTTYLTHGEDALDGWGLNGGAYFQLVGGALDLGSLPSAAASMDADASAQLVNVTPDSPAYGTRSPLLFRWYDDGFDPYWAPGSLAMRPVFGFPLREAETYCAVLTRAVTDDQGRHLSAAPALQEALVDPPDHLAPFVAWLQAADHLNGVDIAAVTCFTTQDATGELRAVASWLDEQEAPTIATVDEPIVWGELHGTYLAPNFQAGEKPYEEEGGDLQFDEGGAPVVQADEEVRFLLMLPYADDDAMPDEGWPVVLYAHGTGGDYESCRGVSTELRGHGYALICVDQPLHGSRGPDGGYSDDELVAYSFNFLNPKAGRMSFRQSAIDTFTLTRMVASGRFDFAPEQTTAGQTVMLDPSRIYFFGHSHGGLSGALVFGVDQLVRGGVLSGAAGVLIETILRRKDPLDLAGLVSGVLGTDLSVLDAFHPMLSVVQMLVDATDPVNYSRYWLDPLPGGHPKHVFVTEGTLDHASPQVGTDAMAAAAGLPLMLPLAKDSLAHTLAGLPELDPPVVHDVETADGPRTAAIHQWQGGNHWVAFNNGQARAMWNRFFETIAAYEPPEIGLGDASVTAPGAASGGDGCGAAGALDGALLPLKVSADTSAAASDHSTGDGCGGGDAGVDRRDLVYVFTAAAEGTHRFRITLPASPDPDEPRPGPNLLYVASACDDIAGTCLGQDNDIVDLDLVPGETVYVVVDGTGLNDKGAFYLQVSLLCEVLDCGDRECGAWGCDGDCGSCPAGEFCDDGTCVGTTLPGDQCDDPLPVDGVPFVHAGDTSGYVPDYGYAGGECPGESSGYGGASGDVVYAFTPDVTDLYVFRLDAAFDSNLWVVADCADPAGTCLKADKRGGGEILQLEVTAGETVLVLVDGAGNSSNSHGPYTLRIDPCVPDCTDKPCGDDGCGGDCGACGALEICIEEETCLPIPYVCADSSVCEPLLQGDVCEDAVPVDALPFSAASTTNAMYDDYAYGGGDCPGEGSGYGGGSDDVVYLFEPEETALYDVKISTNFDSNLYVATSCDDLAGSCVAADEDKGKDKNESLLLELQGGTPYYVVVDGRSNSGNDAGAYTLTIDECVPSCDGKVCGSDGCGGSCGSCGALESCSSGQCKPTTGYLCENARKVNKIPYEHGGNTSSFAPSYADACNGDAGAAANDVAYVFTPSFAATWTIQLSASWEAGFYLVHDCGDVAGSCVAAHGTGSIDVELPEDEPVYILVDGATAETTASGSYTLKVWQTCFPDCTDKTCGGDGCGGSCGTCAYPADLCLEANCTAPDGVEGNTCASALPIGALPWWATGDTTAAGLQNHHGLTDGACGSFAGKGHGAREEVWRLDATTDGLHTVVVDPDGWDAIVYAVGDCVDLAGTCLDVSDGDAAEVLELDLVAGQTVFVVVDGADDVEDWSGAYDLSVEVTAP